MERTYPFVLYSSLQLSAARASIWKRNQRVRIRLFNFPLIWPKRGFLPPYPEEDQQRKTRDPYPHTPWYHDIKDQLWISRTLTYFFARIGCTARFQFAVLERWVPGHILARLAEVTLNSFVQLKEKKYNRIPIIMITFFYSYFNMGYNV